MKRIDYKSGLAFGLATLPGSIAGAYLTGYVRRDIFNIILGCVLIIIAIFLFIKPDEGAYATNKPHKINTTRNITDASGNNYVYSFNIKQGIILSFFVGFLSSFLGIGGGIIHVPALISLLEFPAHIATATSHFVLAIMALSGTIVHLDEWHITTWLAHCIVYWCRRCCWRSGWSSFFKSCKTKSNYKSTRRCIDNCRNSVSIFLMSDV